MGVTWIIHTSFMSKSGQVSAPGKIPFSRSNRGGAMRDTRESACGRREGKDAGADPGCLEVEGDVKPKRLGLHAEAIVEAVRIGIAMEAINVSGANGELIEAEVRAGAKTQGAPESVFIHDLILEEIAADTGEDEGFEEV